MRSWLEIIIVTLPTSALLSDVIAGKLKLCFADESDEMYELDSYNKMWNKPWFYADHLVKWVLNLKSESTLLKLN